jgi:hypothetical protein
MINDRTEQLERPSVTHRSPTARRRILRRPHVAATPSEAASPGRDQRASVAAAFRVLAHGVGPQPAQAQAATFYRSSGQDWARPLGGGEPVSRVRVVNAFRTMAHGVGASTAADAMLRFYRSGDHDWARGLGQAA